MKKSLKDCEFEKVEKKTECKIAQWVEWEMFCSFERNSSLMDLKKKKSLLTLVIEKKKLKKSISTKKVYLKKSDIPPIKIQEPVTVKMKENWVDITTKYSAFAAVILAFITVVFDCSQSRMQDETFRSFNDSLNSMLTQQLENAKTQHEKTISVMKEQQESIQRQNDSTIQLLKIQADRLQVQNEIWKVDQRNKILSERVIISSGIIEQSIKNDSIAFKITYFNFGNREAKNIKCKYAVFTIKNTDISILVDEFAPFTMNKIPPKGGVYWTPPKYLKSPNNLEVVLVYSSLSYEDEMFKNPFTITDYYQIIQRDSNTTDASICNQTQIDYIIEHSLYKDIEIADYTINEKFVIK